MQISFRHTPAVGPADRHENAGYQVQCLPRAPEAWSACCGTQSQSSEVFHDRCAFTRLTPWSAPKTEVIGSLKLAEPQTSVFGTSKLKKFPSGHIQPTACAFARSLAVFGTPGGASIHRRGSETFGTWFWASEAHHGADMEALTFNARAVAVLRGAFSCRVRSA
jgi:hypothetical protein